VAALQGYELYWPDGRPVEVGLNAFCKHGQRLLGLGKHLAGCQEKFIRLICFPLSGLEAKLIRIPGYRVRRFFLERHGRIGRIHFMDGTPTNACFDLDRDEEAVLEWIGLTQIRDGERQWIDLAAIGTEHSSPWDEEDLKLEDAVAVE